MKRAPIISVIMLTFNRERLIGRAIQSILAQSFNDFELIIVDNGSTDNSGYLAERYVQMDERIRVVHKERGSIGSGRNRGLDLACGDMIAFVDDDDVCAPDYLAFLYDLLIENDADVSICGATDKCSEERRIMGPEEALVELFLRKRYNVQFPTKLIRARLLQAIRFAEDAQYDDIELMPKVLAEANKIAFHGLAKYTFYRHEGNHSAWTTNHSLLNAQTLSEYLRVYRERTAWLSQRFPTYAATWRYFEQSFWISMLEKVVRLKLEDCLPLAEVIKSNLRDNQEEFISCEWTQDFEKEWVEQYVNNKENVYSPNHALHVEMQALL